MKNVYDIITDRVIELLEQGVVPWHKPWGGPERMPRSLSSGRPYRGANVFLLSAAGYDSPWWVSFRQARERGGHVKRGERGYPCVFWKIFEKKNNDTGEVKKLPCLRYFTVFNVEQCKDLPYPKYEESERIIDPIEACSQIVREMPQRPHFFLDAGKASYSPATDTVQMPSMNRFESSEEYYSTLFHELVHATGHRDRLSRKGVGGRIIFGTKNYSIEEMVAEMGSTYLCGHSGIDNKVLDNSASYLQGWMDKLRDNEKLLVTSAAQAQKAADFILNQRLAEYVSQGNGRSREGGSQ